jgi:hypothetical protein
MSQVPSQNQGQTRQRCLVRLVGTGRSGREGLKSVLELLSGASQNGNSVSTQAVNLCRFEIVINREIHTLDEDQEDVEATFRHPHLAGGKLSTTIRGRKAFPCDSFYSYNLSNMVWVFH